MITRQDIWDKKGMLSRQEIEEVIKTKGRPWMVMALVDGSIGYHTPKHAEIIIDRFLEGEETDWCERCDACFNRDLKLMLTHDIHHLLYIEEERKEQYQRVLKKMEIFIAENADSSIVSSVSMMYPTM